MLEFFRSFRADVTVLLLDSDSNEPVSGAKVTRERLLSIGYPPNFLDANCLFIGAKEFEDAFATDQIVSVLNMSWPKANGTAWVCDDVNGFRAADKKFSRDLLAQVRGQCVLDRRAYARKPNIGEMLAVECGNSGQVPSKIVEAFQLVRQKLGYDESP